MSNQGFIDINGDDENLGEEEISTTPEEKDFEIINIFEMLGIASQQQTSTKNQKKSIKSTVSKTAEEKRYPLPVTVKYAFQDFVISCDDVSGKKDISLDEIREYLENIGYDELSKERAKMEYDAKTEKFYPMITGGKKGCC